MKRLVLGVLFAAGCYASQLELPPHHQKAAKKHLHLVSHVVVGVAHGVGFVLKTVI